MELPAIAIVWFSIIGVIFLAFVVSTFTRRK
jgi:hypothetical protein